MIRIVDVDTPATPVDVSATALQRIGDTLQGPGRALDPVEAMAADIAEIVGAGHGVDEPALVSRGWGVDEIIEHLPRAVKRARGDVGVEL